VAIVDARDFIHAIGKQKTAIVHRDARVLVRHIIAVEIHNHERTPDAGARRIASVNRGVNGLVVPGIRQRIRVERGESKRGKRNGWFQASVNGLEWKEERVKRREERVVPRSYRDNGCGARANHSLLYPLYSFHSNS
jgi:hypothetical protein